MRTHTHSSMRWRRNTGLFALLATLLLAACGITEQSVDVSELNTAPMLGQGFAVKNHETDTDAQQGSVSNVYFYENSGGAFVILQFESGTEESSSSEDWDLDSAKPLIADVTSGVLSAAEPIVLSPAPNSAGAWTTIAGPSESANLGTKTIFAEAWERNRCVALVITNLSGSDLASAMSIIDAKLIRGCGE